MIRRSALRITAMATSLLCALSGRTSHAQESPSIQSAVHTAREPATPQLRYNLPLDLGVTLGAGALSLTLELLSSKLAPSSCHWCDRDSSGRDTLNGFDASLRSSLRWSNTTAANRASNLFSYGLAPAAGLGLGAFIVWRDNRVDELPLDLLILAEAAILAVDANQISKIIVGRERPYVHFRSAADRESNRSSSDNVSFYSGHTSFAFTLAAAGGTIASLRQYRLAPLIWATGMTLAAVSGYLRVAADRHYASDVLVGAVVGSAIGLSVPYFGHAPVA